MNEQERKIADLESQVLDLAMRINQFSKLFAYMAMNSDPNMTDEVKVKLQKVISGQAGVKSWRIKKDCALEPIFVDD